MISIQHEPTVIVSGCEVTAIARISGTKHALSGKWLFVACKQPLAIICRTEDGEHIFDMDGHQIDAAGLKELMTVDGA